MAMFRALAENDIPALVNLGKSFYSQNNFPATLLCLDRVFAHEFNLGSADSLPEIVAYLQTFLIYARILQRFSCVPDPCANQDLQRLFAFRKATEDNEELFLLPKGCYLCARAQSNGAVEVDGAKGVHIARWDLERLIKIELRDRLKDRVWNENEMCHTLPRLRPCLLFSVSGSCPRRECPQRHTAGSEAGTTYNSLVRIYVLQIMIFHTLYAAEIEYHDLVPQQRSVTQDRTTIRASLTIFLPKSVASPIIRSTIPETSHHWIPPYSFARVHAGINTRSPDYRRVDTGLPQPLVS